MSYLKSRNLLLVLALALALVLVGIVIMRSRTEVQMMALVEALPEGVDLSLQDIDYTHIEKGLPQWRLVAQQVEHKASAGVLGISSPQLIFFTEQGAERGSLIAEKGEVSNDYQLVQLRGQVVLTSAEDYTFYADRLDYDHRTQQATTDGPVRIFSEGLELNGQGMVFDLKQRQLTLLSQVNGTLTPKQQN